MHVIARRLGTVCTSFWHLELDRLSAQTGTLIESWHVQKNQICLLQDHTSYAGPSRFRQQHGWTGYCNAMQRSFCARKEYFWQQLRDGAKASLGSPQNRLDDLGNANVLREVPPAFGGSIFCHGCQDLEMYFWKNYGSRARVVKCICSALGLGSNHYHQDELEEFLNELNEHGSSRRVFSTEYSLGFGPESMQKGDTVWLLHGASSPMILRPSTLSPTRYTFIGPCYLHAATRALDICSICGRKNSRYISRSDDNSRQSRPEDSEECSPLFLSDWHIISIA